MLKSQLNNTLLTTDDVAKILKITRAGVLNRLRKSSDNPPSIKIGKRWYFPAREFQQWLDSKMSTSTTAQEH